MMKLVRFLVTVAVVLLAVSIVAGVGLAIGFSWVLS